MTRRRRMTTLRTVAVRWLLGVSVLVVAAVVAPYAAEPVFNSADIVVAVLPIIFLVAVLPRGRKTPAGDAASPSVDALPRVASPAGSSLERGL